MSNSMAVAMVTAALRRVLGEALAGVPAGGVENARVTTLRPDMLADGDGDARGINIFLYEVAPNGAWTATDLPTRRADGTLLNRPRQALTLHYLLTFSGEEAALEPQRMLGLAVSTLVAQPLLSRDLLRDIVSRDVADDPTTWEQYSDLAEQVDLVRFSLLPVPLEQLSNLWTTFVQSPYRLSMTYQASVVLVERDLSPQPALPVLTRGADVAALQIPEITRVTADTGAGDPIRPGTLLRVEGRRLRGAYATVVRIDGTEVRVPPDDVTDAWLLVTLPGAVRAGVRSIQVRHPRQVGVPPVERGGAESAAAALIVRPVVPGPITAGPSGTPGVTAVTVPLAPPVGRQQRVVLVLNEHHPAPDRTGRAYSFIAPAPAAGAPETAGSVTVPVPGVPAGPYVVRVQVDGAESVLDVGADGRFDAPRVVLP